MLVVIGIILILAGILVPIVGNSWRRAKQTRMAFDMQAIVTGLEAFKHETGAYPSVTSPQIGSKVLADSLIAPADKTVDNEDGPGFRLRAGGKVYGPYLQPDKFKIADGATNKDILGRVIPIGCLLDSGGRPILYYPAHNQQAVISTAGAFISNSTASLYNYADNDMGVIAPSASNYPFTDIKMFEAMMGDVGSNGGNGAIDGSEKAASTGPYLLWSAGPDGLFGPMGKNGQLKASDIPTYDDVRRSDDVTNFQR
jgi:type II secretory pathway pseudopilin PulG